MINLSKDFGLSRSSRAGPRPQARVAEERSEAVFEGCGSGNESGQTRSFDTASATLRLTQDASPENYLKSGTDPTEKTLDRRKNNGIIIKI